MPRMLAWLALAALPWLTGCATADKAPQCKGRYEPVNAPEHYLEPRGRGR